MTKKKASEPGWKAGTVRWWDAVPMAWARHAARLRRSAELLWRPLDHSLTLEPPFSEEDLALWDHSFAFLLVAGAALEAMFKAAAIEAELNRTRSLNIIATPSGRLQRWILTHKVVLIAERAQIELSQDERDELARFTKYVEWAGSYPVSTDLRNPDPNAGIRFDFRVSNFDRIWFDRFYGRAEESYRHHAAEAKRWMTETQREPTE